MLSRLSLRARLLLGVIAIAFAGLVTADVATYAALKSFLIDRVDSTLNSVHQGVSTVFFPQGHDGGGPGFNGGNIQAVLSQIPGYCVEVRGLGGTSVTPEACVPQFGQSQAGRARSSRPGSSCPRFRARPTATASASSPPPP
jgi:hypothetical protein